MIGGTLEHQKMLTETEIEIHHGEARKPFVHNRIDDGRQKTERMEVDMDKSAENQMKGQPTDSDKGNAKMKIGNENDQQAGEIHNQPNPMQEFENKIDENDQPGKTSDGDQGNHEIIGEKQYKGQMTRTNELRQVVNERCRMDNTDKEQSTDIQDNVQRRCRGL